QRAVFIGAMRQRFVEKNMSRRTADDIQHGLIFYALINQALYQAITRPLRGHTDPGEQLVAHASSPVVFVMGAVVSANSRTRLVAKQPRGSVKRSVHVSASVFCHCRSGTSMRSERRSAVSPAFSSARMSSV